MASKYWLKLYHEMLHDPKMIRLDDRLFRRVIQCFLLAGETDRKGLLPSIDDMAVVFRVEVEHLETELTELSKVGILTTSDDRWLVSKFASRQEPVSGAERIKRYRDRQIKDEYYGKDTEVLRNGNENVTKRYTDIDIDKEEDIDIDKIREALSVWAEYFPNKPQPRANTKSIRGKWNTRIKDEHFRDNWKEALIISSKSRTLQSASWFNFNFFIKNDDNYQKMLDNWMAWKDEGEYDPRAELATRLERIENGE